MLGILISDLKVNCIIIYSFLFLFLCYLWIYFFVLHYCFGFLDSHTNILRDHNWMNECDRAIFVFFFFVLVSTRSLISICEYIFLRLAWWSVENMWNHTIIMKWMEISTAVRRQQSRQRRPSDEETNKSNKRQHAKEILFEDNRNT